MHRIPLEKPLLSFILLFCLFSCQAEQEWTMEAEKYQLPAWEELVLHYTEGTTLLFAHEDELFLWDSTLWERPFMLAKERGESLHLFTLLDRLGNPYLDMSPSEAAYRKADSLAWQHNKPPFELGMQSSAKVYSHGLMLTWPKDEKVSTWKIEWRDIFDVVVDSTISMTNSVYFELPDYGERALYIRHPLSKEGSGVFVVQAMEPSERQKIGDMLQGLEETNALHLFAQAALFESQGLYVDALSHYVKLEKQWPDWELPSKLLANYFFRLGFPPLH